MIKDGKEYPATHSMSTAWYIVDDDGNVGIIDYNENGPVPWGVEQTVINELIWGHEENYKLKERIKFNLTEEQIYEAVGKPLKPQECDYWLDIAIRIDINRQDEFDKLSENEDFEIDVCISKELGFYKLDTYHSVFKDDDSTSVSWENLSSNSTLKKMIDENLILEVFKLSEYDIFDEYDKEKDDYIYTKDFETAPYYIYKQPYWNKFLCKKLCEPNHPVKVEQIPEFFRYRLHHVNGNFKKLDYIQIAKHHPSHTYDSGVNIDGCFYSILPNEDKKIAYYLDSILNYFPHDFHETYGDFHERAFSITPTILVVASNNEKDFIKYEIITNNVIHKSAWIPFSAKYREYNDAFEKVANELKPHAIIVRDDIVDEFTLSYNIDNHIININNEQIPVYKFSELETFREEITALAKMPYRGKKYRLEISQEEMNQLLEERKAKYND